MSRLDLVFYKRYLLPFVIPDINSEHRDDWNSGLLCSLGKPKSLTPQHVIVMVS